MAYANQPAKSLDCKEGRWNVDDAAGSLWAVWCDFLSVLSFPPCIIVPIS